MHLMFGDAYLTTNLRTKLEFQFWFSFQSSCSVFSIDFAKGKTYKKKEVEELNYK